jgi:hypothetical protein
MFFFWYKPEEQQQIRSELRRMNRTDLIDKLFEGAQMKHYDYAKKSYRSDGNRNNKQRTYSKNRKK